MSSAFFEARIPGKWVLTGEHAVLQGMTAVALPHPSFFLTLRFKPKSGQKLKVMPAEVESEILELIRAIADSREEQNFSEPEGELDILSSIPLGAGLGSSAALCVAITQWLSPTLKIKPEDFFEFATQLEHRFHGKSSGMDVAVILANEPVSFVRGRGAIPLGIKRIPKFTFHDTGLRARTSDCVIKVESFREENRTLALKVDEAMGQASRLSMEGLFAFDSGEVKTGLELLAKAMKQAQECFYTWELVPGEAKRIQDQLYRQGALGVKLTGAGGGGMLVALWPDQPPK